MHCCFYDLLLTHGTAGGILLSASNEFIQVWALKILHTQLLMQQSTRGYPTFYKKKTTRKLSAEWMTSHLSVHELVMMTKSSHFSDDLVMTFFNIYCHIIGFMLLVTASAILFIFRSHLRVVVFFGGGGCVKYGYSRYSISAISLRYSKVNECWQCCLSLDADSISTCICGVTVRCTL